MLERDDQEHPIPPQLHMMFFAVVAAFLQQDFELCKRPVAGVEPIDASTAKSIVDNITAYDDVLVP